jgi:hypothetical protein
LISDEFRGQSGQPVELTLSPSVIHREAVTLGEAAIRKTLANEFKALFVSASEALPRIPITGSSACCARAASGHAAALPSAAMNFRRRIASPKLRDKTSYRAKAVEWKWG